MHVYRTGLFLGALAACAAGAITSLGACSSPRQTPPGPDGEHTTPAAAPGQTTIAFDNGQWFDGDAFVAGTRYVVGGVLRESRPARVDLTIDLGGGFVVPPYGEGHTHLMESELVDVYVQQFLYRGIFYVKDRGSARSIRQAIASKVNRPSSIDAVFGDAPFTGPGGSPLQVIKQLQDLGVLPAAWTSEDIDGDAAIIVRDSADLAARWDEFLAGKPDFVEIFLLYSEEYHQRKSDPAYEYRHGIDPALVPEIVTRARKAHLPVSAHVYTASDFRTAVAAGVDEISHLPGIGYDKNLGADAFRLGDDDVKRAAGAGVRVVTTLTKIVEDALSSPEVKTYLDDVVRSNLTRLRAAGVTVLIGSDQFRRTCDIEAMHLSRSGLFDNLALLRAFSVDTPRAIFPDRRVGGLGDGYEASFLVLEGNPLEEPSNLFRIGLRVKKGEIVLPRMRDFPRPGKE